MEICKAPTLRLKALNKHSITHIMYTERENVISNLKIKKVSIYCLKLPSDCYSIFPGDSREITPNHLLFANPVEFCV